MDISKEKTLANIDIKELTQFLTLAGLAILIPAFFHIQWVTGPIVNAILIITCLLLGIKRAMVIALVPSLIALSVGLLPAVLALAVPFIMLSNIVYVLVIDYVYNNFGSHDKSYWWGILLGSGLKFVVLFLSAGFVVKLFTSETIAVKIGQMMTWTQFATALLGGMLAWIVLKRFKNF